MGKLSDIFQISYGTKFDFNKMDVCEDNFLGGINFVSRTSQNNGIVAKVKQFEDKKPLKAGQITVSLGGSYVLSAFLQLEDFYTAQNVAVLKPLFDLSERELFYYCMCITKNRFRYGAFGREANTTLKDLLIPSIKEIPDFVYNSKIPDYGDIKESINNKKIILNEREFKYFEIKDLFEVKRGNSKIKTNEIEDYIGSTNFVSALTRNNGVLGKVNFEPNFNGNSITIANSGEGSVGFSFYQEKSFYATSTVNVLYPKFLLNKFIGIYLTVIFKKERYRYSFGRGWNLEKMKTSKIKLPVDNSGNPDWYFMEEYIKSLPYSKYL